MTTTTNDRNDLNGMEGQMEMEMEKDYFIFEMILLFYYFNPYNL